MRKMILEPVRLFITLIAMRIGTLERVAETRGGLCAWRWTGRMIPGPETTVDSSTRSASAAVTIANFSFFAAGFEDEGVGGDWRRERGTPWSCI